MNHDRKSNLIITLTRCNNTTIFLLISFWTLLMPMQSFGIIECEEQGKENLQRCEAGIDPKKLDIVTAKVQGQHKDQWCWAACLEMLFTYHGKRFSQEEIVRNVYGSTVNVGGSYDTIFTLLNSKYTNDIGSSFRTKYQEVAGLNSIIKHLKNDKPLLLIFSTGMYTGHAVLLTAVSYFFRPSEDKVILETLVVRDPWYQTAKEHRRELDAAEFHNIRHILAVDII